MRKGLCIFISMIPALGCLIVFNQVEPYVLGFPFVLFWEIMWVVLTSLFLSLVYFLDPANKKADES